MQMRDEILEASFERKTDQEEWWYYFVQTRIF